MRISLASEQGVLRLSICDNGRGFAVLAKNPADPGDGHQNHAISRRQLGATLEFLRRPEGGVEVRLEMRMV